MSVACVSRLSGGQGQAELHVLQPDGAQQRGPGGALYVSDAQGEAGQREVLGMVQRYQQDIGGSAGTRRARPGLPGTATSRGRRPGLPVAHDGQARSPCGIPDRSAAAHLPSGRSMSTIGGGLPATRTRPAPRQPGLQPMPKQVRVRHVRVPGRGLLRARGQVQARSSRARDVGASFRAASCRVIVFLFVGAWAVASSIWRRHRRGNGRRRLRRTFRRTGSWRHACIEARTGGQADDRRRLVDRPRGTRAAPGAAAERPRVAEHLDVAPRTVSKWEQLGEAAGPTLTSRRSWTRPWTGRGFSTLKPRTVVTRLPDSVELIHRIRLLSCSSTTATDTLRLRSVAALPA